MKNTFFIPLFFLFACSGNGDEITTDIIKHPASANGSVKHDLPEMTFENELFDFGVITQGETVKHSFKFKNTGNANLVISNAKGSCGCTVPEWPKNPLKPGENGEITVVFDSDGKSGRQHKKISIVANTHPSTNLIAISGEVVAPTNL